MCERIQERFRQMRRGRRCRYSLHAPGRRGSRPRGPHDADGRPGRRKVPGSGELPSAPCRMRQIAKLAPMGMIFVPSRGGISHSPRRSPPGRTLRTARRFSSAPSCFSTSD
jgi:hypothetical protein